MSNKRRPPKADTMKCVKLTDGIQRVSNEEAARLVAQGGQYCSKSDWKKAK